MNGNRQFAVRACLTIVVLTWAPATASADRAQPPGEPYRVELFAEPREQTLSEIWWHVTGVTLEYAVRAVDVADYGGEAENVNAFDEVADCEWFVNRLGRHALTAADVATGPNQAGGPDQHRPWRVLSLKEAGTTPGLMIKDATGARFMLKFDPAGSAELGTAAEIIGNRIVWAAGYHTPETYLVMFPESDLELSPETEGLTPQRLGPWLERVARTPDGQLRAVATRWLPGTPKGPFLFVGTRPDDPNDRVDHRHRRELRGLTLVFALINNTDWKETNTLDMYVPVGTGGYLKHYLLDFNQSLGAGVSGPKEAWGGFEYLVDLKGIGWSHFTLGLSDRAWERARYPAHRSVGTFESKTFEARHWHPWRAVPPFLYVTARDGFWAARILANLSDEHLAAIVRSACYSDPAAETYVLDTLRERRDKIVRSWMSPFTPLRRFRIVGRQVHGEDLWVVCGYARSDQARYRYRFDDGGWIETPTPQFPLPSQRIQSLRIQARYGPGQDWRRHVTVRLQDMTGRRPTILGLRR